MATFQQRKLRRDLTRRSFLGGAAALATAGGLWYPRKAHAAGIERKFLFCFASGGWDTTTVLDPHFDVPGVDMAVDTVLGTAGKLAYTSGAGREGTDQFFRNWGGYTAIINGIDAHSVGHDSGTQFMMTGTSASSYADWPTLLAANSVLDYPLPHVVFGGPSYPGTSGAAVVRAGGGTLLSLLDGSINGMSDAPAPVMMPPADDAIDQFVFNRVADFAGQQRGIARDRAEGLVQNIERAMELEGREFEAGLDDLGNNLLDNMIKASELMRLGLSRTAMLRIPGGFDTHGNDTTQSLRQEAFYTALNDLFEHLATTPGHTSDWLINEVTVVALSEFGRTPRLNGGGGKDHWPYNSMLVAGAGVKGNAMYGKTDDALIAETIDLSTGLPSASGVNLGCEHVGTALLKIGGLDSEQFLQVPSLDALVRGAT